MRCQNGHEIAADVNFCSQCGAARVAGGPPDYSYEGREESTAAGDAKGTSQQGPRRAVVLAVAAGVAAMLIGGIIAATQISDDSDDSDSLENAAPQKSRLETAYESCNSGDGAKTLTIQDAGRSLIVDTGGKYTGTFEGVQCVWEALGTSEGLKASVGSTTALQGARNATDNGLDYSWSYHPDNGLNMVIKEP